MKTMETMKTTTARLAEVRKILEVLEHWAHSTRIGAQDEVLINHEPSAIIYDVLPPMKYVGTDAYRKSWDEWQPETEGAARFDLHEVEVTAGADIAFAHGLIHCGGTTTSGTTFEDWVRATFCLRKHGGRWLIAHQHISMPRG
jgi:ketosteroid isomerase-like protein